MKNLSRSIKCIIAILIELVFCFQVYPQSGCVTSEPQLPSTTNYAMASSNGWILPATGTIRILFVLVEVNYTGTIPDPQPASGSTVWPAHQLPTWVNNTNPHVWRSLKREQNISLNEIF